MSADFLPTREAELLTWSANLNRLINVTPEAFSLTAAQATAYDALHTAYAAALQVASDPSTRTPSSIVTKNDAKGVLIDHARELARIIQASPEVTDTQRSDLGLTVRDDEPSPVPDPKVAPTLTIESTYARRITIRLKDAQNADNNGKPGGVQGATVLYHVGEMPSDDPSQWIFGRNVSRTHFALDIPVQVPAGSKVWVTAFWFNARKESSPGSTPMSTRISDGLSKAA